MNLELMSKFEFLLGSWDLEYRIPKSSFGEDGTDSGTGSFKRSLNDKYVIFDYSTKSGVEAHAIFAWDDKDGHYKYWWFENTGNFMTASCNFIDKNTLFMNWDNTHLTQTFVRDSSNRVVLRMQNEGDQGMPELILEVIFTRKKSA
jgi:hypothetical protein